MLQKQNFLSVINKKAQVFKFNNYAIERYIYNVAFKIMAGLPRLRLCFYYVLLIHCTLIRITKIFSTEGEDLFFN